MNGSITQKILLVIVLVVLMGAGALTQPNGTNIKSPADSAWVSTSMAAASWPQSGHGGMCSHYIAAPSNDSESPLRANRVVTLLIKE
ncbi:MAG: hypothetical protein ABI670_22850 [Chloroflexota bacterium]